MSLLSKWWFGRTGTEVQEMDYYQVKNIGNIIMPEKLSDKNAFTLANSVAEIFFPIDFYADRISKLRFFIANKQGREVASSELNRFVSDSINPLFQFSDLIYFHVFSLLSDGNAINYVSVPSTYSKVSASNITRWDVLQPNMTSLDEYSNMSMLNASSWNEFIRRAYYSEGGISREELKTNGLVINNYSVRKRSNSYVLASSPLWNANKSIDTLLAVYSARYNVYANNGAAGYLSRKLSGSGGQNEAYAAALMDGSKRDEIIKDINERNGLTGSRNIWGISGIPIEFVKTIASIQELMPFEETLEDSIKIAGIYSIPSDLVPRKDHSTYDNQKGQERSVWENGLLSMAKTVCANLTKMFGLDKYGNYINFDISNVSALMENEGEEQDIITKKLINLEKIKQMNPDIDTSNYINEIFNSYGNK